MHEFQKRLDTALAHAKHAISGIRGGRATVALVEDMVVECYGSMMPLKQLATVSVPEPRTLAIAPWDKQIIPDVVRALERADLGAMPIVHGDTIHVTLPPLTQERRAQIVKMVGKLVEEGRIAIRRVREEALDVLKKDKDSGAFSEDEFFRKKDELEELVKKANETLARLQERKEEEIRDVS